MKFPTFSKSKLSVGILITVAELVILLLVFRVGMMAGFRKANFSYRWGENYHQLFGGPRHGWLREFGRDDYINSNGIAGSVLEVVSSTLTIRGNDNVEKSILLTGSTVIQKNNLKISPADIKPDDRVMAIGTPSTTGQLEAKFVRIFNAK